MSHETERLDLTTSKMMLRITKIFQICLERSKMTLDTHRIQIHVTSFFGSTLKIIIILEIQKQRRVK